MKAYDTLEEAQQAMRDVFEFDVEKAVEEEKVDGYWAKDRLSCGVMGSDGDYYYDEDSEEDGESEEYYNEYDLCCQILVVDAE